MVQGRRYILWVSLVAALLLSACTSVPVRRVSPPLAFGASPGSAAAFTILVPGNDTALDDLITAYYAKHPTVRIIKSPLTRGQNEASALRTRLEDGTVDLVVLSVGSTAASLIESGMLEPLDPYIDLNRVNLAPFGPALDQLRVDGRLYELPYRVIPTVLLYNQDMFQAAGVPVPSSRWTWDQFADAARTLTKGEGENKVWGLATSGHAQLFQAWVYHRKGATTATDSSTLQEGLQFFESLIFSAEVIPPAANAKFGSAPGMDDRFEQRRAAMTLRAMINFQTLALPFRWELVALPSQDGTATVTPVNPYTLAMAANSRNKEAAWAFLEFASGSEGAQSLARAGHLPMYRTSELKRAWFDRRPAPLGGTEVLFDSVWYLSGRGRTSEQAIEQAQANLVTRVLSGSVDRDRAVSEYLQEAEGIRAEAGR